MLDVIRARAVSAAGRWSLVAIYVLGGLVFAFGLPDTPDEISRIREVRAVLDGATYSFFWPAGNMAAIVLNPLFHAGMMADPQAVRLFNFLLSAPPILWLILRCRQPLALAAALVVMPYMWLVTATASQQGLMLPLLVLLLWGAVDRRALMVSSAAAGLFLVNPAMLVVVPGGLLLVASLRPELLTSARAALLGVLPFAAVVAVAWALTGEVHPTLSGNGAFNLWLGNNPDPLAHRGVAPRPLPTDPVAALVDFLRTEGGVFVENLLRKIALYWAPWDYMRSGLGGDLQAVFFAYVAVAQVMIYGTAFALRREARPDALLTALAIALFAWALYSAFFVKVRFRVPFDLLILAAVMLPARDLPAQRSADEARRATMTRD